MTNPVARARGTTRVARPEALRRAWRTSITSVEDSGRAIRRWTTSVVPRARHVLAAVLALACTGCVERRYTIRTDPPGALVYVNGEELGPAAPAVSRSFTHYGAREIVLIADGFQTQRIVQPLDAPWYDNFLTDFVSECLVPWTIRDEREFVYRMAPAVNPPSGDLVQRAEALRGEAQFTPPPQRRGLFDWFGR